MKHIGSVVLNEDITLHNVLYVPHFKYNFISVHKLCKDLKCEMHFTHDKCFICCQKGMLFPLGDVSSSLYNMGEQKLKEVAFVQSHVCNTTCSFVVNNEKLWILRIGHLHCSQLKLITLSCEVNSCTRYYMSSLPCSQTNQAWFST